MAETVQTFLQDYSDVIPPEQIGQLVYFLQVIQRVFMAFGLLFVASGWGIQQGHRWGRWAGLASAIVNVFFFLPAGIMGLVVFSQKEEGVSAVDDEPGKKSAPKKKAEGQEPVSHLLVMVASIALVVYLSYWLRRYAAGLGLPVDPNERVSIEWILLGQLGFTLIHELGHLLAAWAVGFQFHEINVGPFTLTERPGGSWAFHFDLHKILSAGGYMAAVPTTEKDLRMNWILVVLAGPAASLFLAMIAFLTLVSLPGTANTGLWSVACFVTAICLSDCIANLLPLGMTDGALFVHTALNTKRGKGILARLEAAMLNDRADRQSGLMDPAELLETRRLALEQLEKDAQASALAVAAQRIEFARASLRNGKADAASEALLEAGKALATVADVPTMVWFRYWTDVFETATARRQYSAAANARDQALEFGKTLRGEKMDWEESVPVVVACARLWMSDGDFYLAVDAVREAREACPARRELTPQAVELLTVEAECELRLGRREAAQALVQAAAEIAGSLTDAQGATAMELLAHTAVRLSASGEHAFAEPLFAAGVQGLEKAASASVAAGYRTAWAESRYEAGRLEEAARILEPIHSAPVGFSLDIETLRAQLLLAEDRPGDALTVLNTLLTSAADPQEDSARMGVARSMALRSWALFRSGNGEAALTDARTACDVLMPTEHPDAAPALLTLSMAVESSNGELAEAYFHESTRLICETELLTPSGKVSRLNDLARATLQANRKDMAKDILELAARFKGEPQRVVAPPSMKAPALAN